MKLYFFAILLVFSNIKMSGQDKFPALDSNIKKCIYGITILPKEIRDQLTSLKNDSSRIIFIPSFMGTAFLVSRSFFVSAHHVINQLNVQNGVLLLVNNDHILVGGQLIDVNPNFDYTLGSIFGDPKEFLEVEKETYDFRYHSPFASLGFSDDSSSTIQIRVKKRGADLVFSLLTYLKLKVTYCKFIGSKIVDEFSSSTKKVLLNNCKVQLYDTESTLGMSGGPVINLSNNRVVGFNCMQGDYIADFGKREHGGIAVSLDNFQFLRLLK